MTDRMRQTSCKSLKGTALSGGKEKQWFCIELSEHDRVWDQHVL